MADLQQPEWAYFDGDVRPWSEAVLHVDSEAVKRGLNVFEGMKGYWSADGSEFGVVALPRHFARLQRSARILHVPCPVGPREFEEACRKLVGRLLGPDRDMWVRATLFVTEGHWGQDDRSDLVLTAFHQPAERPEPIALGVSTWQRASDVTVPPRVKAGTNYQVSRLARIEGRGRGYGEMVLLNRAGRVSEATGSCVLVVRGGTVFTPPATEGVLESITVDIIEALCGPLGIPFVRRPIDRTELQVADELGVAGTLAEIVKVHRFEEIDMPEHTPILDAIADRFWAAARQEDPHEAVDLTVLARRAELS
ncbi:MAG: aminotransferase class IV [Candidatus Palauibacterales bacterium]|nr:aminotransferase class IV [Candidatus Palauibacterales bacterium]